MAQQSLDQPIFNSPYGEPTKGHTEDERLIVDQEGTGGHGVTVPHRMLMANIGWMRTGARRNGRGRHAACPNFVRSERDRRL